MHDFIDKKEVNETIAKAEPVEERVNEILKTALELKGLGIGEAAILLNIKDNKILKKLYKTAFIIKNRIYGNRLVLFAPLYISSFCSNNCLYCGFRKDNKEMHRRTLAIEEIKQEVRAIQDQGHKRILMLMGENFENCSLSYFIKAIREAYSVKSKNGSIRRINVEIPPLSVEEFKKLKKAKIGTYTLFQETYHKKTYKEMHPSGKKSDYYWRLYAMDRAQEAGIDDVGIGALFGLYDYRFEVLSLLLHSRHLEEKVGTGPHTISIPRIEPAQNAPVANNPPYPVSDKDFQKLVAVIRCSVPYTGMILSTREPVEMRQKLFNLGVSQISAGSKTSIGGYGKEKKEEGQFSLNDTRATEEVIKDIIKKEFIPSFCTACYRLGRTGKDFMDLAKPGLIQNFCQPNALLTLQEYLEDYADEETKKYGRELIKKESGKIKNKSFFEKIERIKNGERDLYL